MRKLIVFFTAFIFSFNASALTSDFNLAVGKDYTVNCMAATFKSYSFVRVVLRSKKGYTVSDKHPITLSLNLDKDLKVAKTKLTKKDLATNTPVKKHFDIDIDIDTNAPGQKLVEATATFHVCASNVCEKRVQTVKTVVGR